MSRIIKIIGNARITKVQRKRDELINWSRRNGYLGFEGYLVIKLDEEGKLYACIDNERRAIETSSGELQLAEGKAVFSTKNSVYTFELVEAS